MNTREISKNPRIARIVFDCGMASDPAMMPSMNPAHSQHVYEIRPRRDHRGVAAISDALPFIIALIVGGVLVFILLYFESFLVTRHQDATRRMP